jgi:hypothetical protein
MQTIEDKTVSMLRIHYLVSFIVLGSFFLLIFFKGIKFVEAPQEFGLAVNQYSILITLIAIPAALKIYVNILRKKTDAVLPTSVNAILQYKKAFYIRLYVLNVVILGNVLLYAFSYDRNYAWLTVVLFIALLFCKPSYSDLIDLTGNENDEQIA